MQDTRAGRGRELDHWVRWGKGPWAPNREQVNYKRKTLISYMSKKLEALILPVHDCQGLSQVVGLQGGCLAGSVCAALWLAVQKCGFPVSSLPIHPCLPPARFHRGVVEGGVRKVSGAAEAEEQRVEMQRGISSERCSAVIGHLPLLHSLLGPPHLQNYSESISIT